MPLLGTSALFELLLLGGFVVLGFVVGLLLFGVCCCVVVVWVLSCCCGLGFVVVVVAWGLLLFFWLGVCCCFSPLAGDVWGDRSSFCSRSWTPESPAVPIRRFPIVRSRPAVLVVPTGRGSRVEEVDRLSVACNRGKG